MHHPVRAGRQGLWQTAHEAVLARLAGGTRRFLTALVRRVGRHAAIAGCAYCGTALPIGTQNCCNCGAASPPPPKSAAAKRKTGTLTATVVLWYMGGFLGLHCYPAGRPVRGLIYLASMIGTLFMAMSLDLTGRGPSLSTFGAVGLGAGLTALWVFDGVQILRGRFV